MYVCDNCGQESAKWIGKCPACGQWNTFKEIKVASSSPKLGETRKGLNKGTSAQSSALATGKVLRLKDISSHDDPRIDMHDAELNRVLGGGLVPGSIVLLGGEPGIGKSTLSLQTMLQLTDKKVLYVSGEESAHQLKMRAERLAVSGSPTDNNSHLRAYQRGTTGGGGSRLHTDHFHRRCRVERRFHRPGSRVRLRPTPLCQDQRRTRHPDWPHHQGGYVGRPKDP